MKVALITYHSAYNFGSVLQAYATEKVLNKLGCNTSVIDYRIPFQKKYYGLLGYGNGFLRSIVKKTLMLPYLKKRIIREKKYEDFISTMNLTSEFNSPEQFDENLSNMYDVFVSGSDQVWNIHSNEFIKSGYEFMLPFLLSFTNKRKISYASSIVNMSDHELEKIKPYLQRFNHISCRERKAAERLTNLLQRNVDNVLDPTLLLESDEWNSLIEEKSYNNCGYILYYSLNSYCKVKKDLKYLSSLSSHLDLKILVLTPLIPCVKDHNIYNIIDAGPLDFIKLLKNSYYVITDSYHGMLFSINFKKNFYLLNQSGDHGVRANDVLSSLNLLSRSIDSIEKIDLKSIINYETAFQALNILRDKSIRYLKNALEQ